MTITEEAAGPDAAVLVLEGRLDTGGAEAAERVLLAAVASRARVVADLSAVPYVSSAGLRVLLRAAKAALAGGHAFALCGLRPMVREVFDMMGFDVLISVHADRDGALGQGN